MLPFTTNLPQQILLPYLRENAIEQVHMKLLSPHHTNPFKQIYEAWVVSSPCKSRNMD